MDRNLTHLDTLALLSLAIFLILNLMMWTIMPHAEIFDVMRSSLLAVAFYVIPIVLAHFKLRIAYHILGLVMIIYTIGFIFSLSFYFNPRLSILTKLIVIPLAVGGIIVNVVWYRLLFKNLKHHLQMHYHHKNNHKEGQV